MNTVENEGCDEAFEVISSSEIEKGLFDYLGLCLLELSGLWCLTFQ